MIELEIVNKVDMISQFQHEMEWDSFCSTFHRERLSSKNNRTKVGGESLCEIVECESKFLNKNKLVFLLLGLFCQTSRSTYFLLNMAIGYHQAHTSV